MKHLARRLAIVCALAIGCASFVYADYCGNCCDCGCTGGGSGGGLPPVIILTQ